MITTETSGVWGLDDVFAKVNAQKWRPNGVGLFGTGYGDVIGANDNSIVYSSPVQIPGTRWSSISAGVRYTLATKNDGTLWTWGGNFNGQLGQNNRTYYSSPIQIPGNNWNSVSAGGGNNAIASATKTDGTLWAWGYNTDSGQLGQNNRTPYSSPVQIPGTQWSSVNSGAYFTIATKNNGTLWAWGGNGSGPLGQSDKTPRSSPVQIPGTNWSSISVAANQSLAIKTDGTLWAWGYNTNYGQLGQNNLTSYSSPVQIPGTTWRSVSGGGGHALATKTDGTLWAWGYNGANGWGRLGQNDVNPYSSPVQIPGTEWSSVITAGAPRATSSGASFAIKTDGTLWAWGQNNNGNLGQNDTTRYSSPVQIPGTNWVDVEGGEIGTIMLQSIYI